MELFFVFQQPQDAHQQKNKSGFVQLRGMQWGTQWFGLARFVCKRNAQKVVGRGAVATTCHKTPNATEAVHDAGNYGHYIEHGERWNAMLSEEPDHCGYAKQKRPVENKPTA